MFMFRVGELLSLCATAYTANLCCRSINAGGQVFICKSIIKFGKLMINSPWSVGL